MKYCLTKNSNTRLIEDYTRFQAGRYRDVDDLFISFELEKEEFTFLMEHDRKVGLYLHTLEYRGKYDSIVQHAVTERYLQ